MSKIFDLICELQKFPCVTGREGAFDGVPFFDAKSDAFGNLFLIKKSNRKGAAKILVEAHRDEIGLVVKDILEGGFVSAVTCGGFNKKILPGTEFMIFGKRKVSALAAALPPHLKKKDGQSDDKKDDGTVLLDTGLCSKECTEKMISAGDLVHFSAAPNVMHGDAIVSRGLDNKASVAALLLAFHGVCDPKNDVCFLFSAGEESTSYGIKNFCRDYKPDLGIVVDVGFGYCAGLDRSACIMMGEGPSVSVSDTLSKSACDWVISVAEKEKIPLQIVAEPGGTGTSATALQTSCGGVPSVVLSIPLLNMHTSSEIVLERDIKATADLIVKLLNR